MQINLIGITLERDKVELSSDNMLTSWYLFHLGHQYLLRGNFASGTQLVFVFTFPPCKDRTDCHLGKSIHVITRSIQHPCDVIDGAKKNSNFGNKSSSNG